MVTAAALVWADVSVSLHFVQGHQDCVFATVGLARPQGGNTALHSALACCGANAPSKQIAIKSRTRHARMVSAHVRAEVVKQPRRSTWQTLTRRNSVA